MARTGPALSPTVRFLAALYGVLALGFGVVVGGAQLTFALDGCRTCWIALPLMIAVAVVGALCIRAAVRRGG
jgi:hypothetical protein